MSPFKGNLEEYKKILTAIIKYLPPNKNFYEFNGTLKLKKDPIPEEITIKNVLLKGSTITYTDWAIAIVLYIGYDTKVSQNPIDLWSLFMNEFFYKTFLNKINLITIFIVAVEVVVCTIRMSSTPNVFQIIFKENIVEILITNFVLMIPLNLYTIVQDFHLIQKFILEKKYKEKLMICNPEKLSFMSQITHLIVERNVAIENPNTKTSIHSIYIAKEKKFYLVPKEIENKSDSPVIIRRSSSRINKKIKLANKKRSPFHQNLK